MMFSALFSSVRQYPRELILAVVAMIGFFVQIESVGPVERLGLHIAFSALLSMNLSLAATVLTRSGKINNVLSWGAWAVTSAAFSWYVMGLDFARSADAYSYAYLLCLVHLCVVLSWTSYGSVERFWNASIMMFHRILYALVFSSFLELGLGLSILALRFLFGFDGLVHLESYTAVLVFVGFNTMFFLSGMPTTESVDHEPRLDPMTSIFSRYVLAPLVFLFIVILWAYGVMVLLGDMKSDMAYYITLLAGGSIFSSLLTWPMRAEKTFPWRILHRYVMLVLLPLILLALWVWYQHLSKDGVDLEGFTIASLLVVSLIVALGSIVQRSLDPRVPAFVLFCAAAGTSIGPLSVASVSERSLIAHGKSLEQSTPKDSAKARATDSVRTSLPAYGIRSYDDESVWITSFVVNDLIEGDTLTLSTDDGSVQIQIPRYSTIATITNTVSQDTIVFDVKGLLGTSSDSLRTITVEGRNLKTQVMPSDVTIIRSNGQWYVSRVAASTHSMRKRSFR